MACYNSHNCLFFIGGLWLIRTPISNKKSDKTFKVVFHNLGLRSWIECDLCWDCPRGDGKGCCYYNPTYYPTDFIYLMDVKPQALQEILNMPYITFLEKYVSLDRVEDEEGDYLCQFHSITGGCRWAPDLRESVCRFYICPGCRIWEEEKVEIWKKFFTKVEEYESKINQEISLVMENRGLDLRSNTMDFIKQASEYFHERWSFNPDWCQEYPKGQVLIINRTLEYGKNWRI